MTETDVEGNEIDVEGTPAASEPSVPDGDDQAASEGAEAPAVEESEVEDAPEPEDDGA